MKTLSYKLFSLLLAGLFLVSSCDTDELIDMNENPNAAEEIDPSYMLAYSMLRISGDRYESWRGVMIYSSTMIQHNAALQTYWSGDKYLYSAQYSGALFEAAYPNYVKMLAAVIEQTKDDPAKGNVYGIARILWVLGMSRLTDMYGDIPYFEAGRGFYDNNYSPAYDPQSEIYADMLKQLEEAPSTFDASLTDLGDNGVQDVIYQGDLNKWEKFANSLMLRLAMRVSKVDPAMAQEYVGKAIAGGLMESNSDNAYVQHTDGPVGLNQNGIGQVFLADDNQRLSKTFVDWMLNHNDPRIEVIATLNQDDIYNGLPNGYDATTIKEYEGTGEEAVPIELYSTTNPELVTLDAPMFFQTYAEVELLLAEASILGWHNGDPETHYNNGVRANMQHFTTYNESLAISDEQVDAYLAANPYNSANGLEMIGEQYWIATFLNDYESWANWRRTGYPVLTPTNYPGNITGGQIPRRLRYFEGEYGNNGEQLQAAIARQGPDEFTTRIWWDVE
ncbi:SusD/RagB family nutrient-binding outer membrane lipoprotein [Porifericola rhodea]|uniref:SusD/RagB family nutrient-binding outer membrane lipoprotein n=1 Tax=Porifericola rhodea TaxID=930972 RepID=UPI0026668D39|nr:SusD/RagB family nutrient-binding outer membrane lipoprotein [Porifericola rhodea]WKN30718.1 SusD/RagB family nutrient-binding outer membrane lipoprotein [Porifericola rhodea]